MELTDDEVDSWREEQELGPEHLRCQTCHGRRVVVTEYNGDGEWLTVPARGFESGQRDCPDCDDELPSEDADATDS